MLSSLRAISITRSETDIATEDGYHAGPGENTDRKYREVMTYRRVTHEAKRPRLAVYTARMIASGKGEETGNHMMGI